MIRFKQFLAEGGAFGHLSNIQEINEFTFSDLSELITNILAGKIDRAKEKTDGQNLLVTWKSGQLLAARNKSHLKNAGEKSMPFDGLKNMFAGRGSVQMAFTSAMKDLETAIKKLTQKQKDKIFNQGKKFMSVEVIHSSNPNVIHYGSDEIRFHGTLQYNDEGIAVSQLNQEEGRILAGMLKQIQQNEQTNFSIKSLSVVALAKLPNFTSLQSKYLSELKKIMKDAGVGNSDTIGQYKINKWQEEIEKQLPDIPDDLKRSLVDRWAKGIKSPSIVALLKPYPELKNEIRKLDKKASVIFKKIITPLELLFLNVGQEVISSMTTFMSVNPDVSVQKMKDSIQSVKAEISKSNDDKIRDKMTAELERLDKIGGIEAIAPTEGITFFYKGELLKLTGTFAPVNQILNLIWRI